jgi:hypothetical protein
MAMSGPGHGLAYLENMSAGIRPAKSVAWRREVQPGLASLSGRQLMKKSLAIDRA